MHNMLTIAMKITQHTSVKMTTENIWHRRTSWRVNYNSQPRLNS